MNTDKLQEAADWVTRANWGELLPGEPRHDQSAWRVDESNNGASANRTVCVAGWVVETTANCEWAGAHTVRMDGLVWPVIDAGMAILGIVPSEANELFLRAQTPSEVVNTIDNILEHHWECNCSDGAIRC